MCYIYICIIQISQICTRLHDFFCAGFHGTEGPLYVKDSYIEEAAKFVSRAFREKGVPAPHDVAGESQIGQCVK